MLASIVGRLQGVAAHRALLRIGAATLEVLYPAADRATLEQMIGQELTFHTLLYLEGDPSRGNLEPRIIGFLSPQDKRFFELFTTVKGIGTRTALRALSVPVPEIVDAIERRDARALVELDGIGKRTAELIVAELSGKLGEFARAVAAPTRRWTQEEEDAILLLVQAGERRPDAEALLGRVRQTQPDLHDTAGLWRAMLRLRAPA